MIPTPTLAFLFASLACVCQLSSANPLHPVHDNSVLYHESSDLYRTGNGLHQRSQEQSTKEKLSRRTDNDSGEADAGDDASWIHDHSDLGDLELGELLDELGMSYRNVRDLVKRVAAAGDPATCTTAPPPAPTNAPPAATASSTAPPQPAPSGPSREGPRNMNVVYYAQSPATGEVPLPNICADPNIDVVILSFITDFYTAGGYPTLNLASKCWAANAAQVAAGATGLIDCVGDGFATQVATCQQAGKKVMLSVGGAIATNNLPSAEGAVTAAKMIWGLFLGGNDPKLSPLRPFGPDIKLDGIDIDNEAPAYKTYIPDLVKALRAEFAADQSKRYYLSAAPQCPRPDQSIPMPQIIPELDFVFVQFYNNPSCNLPSGSGFLDSLRAWSQDLISASGGSSSSSSQPPNSASSPPPMYQIAPPAPPRPRPRPQQRRRHLSRATLSSSTNGGPGPKLFIGVLATPGSGYVEPSGLKAILDQVKGLNIPNLGGVMYWDGAYQALSGKNGGKTYAQVVRETLA